MGAVRQAVLEFDEEVRAPWRPLLTVVPQHEDDGPVGRVPVRAAGRHPGRRSPSRVAACRPAASRRNGAGLPTQQARTVAVTPAAQVRHGEAPTPLRLTRRARRLAVVLSLSAGVALGSWVAPLVDGGGDGFRLANESSVVVQEGDSVWSIASTAAGDADVRAVVDAIQRLNQLDGAPLVPGQVLQLP